MDVLTDPRYRVFCLTFSYLFVCMFSENHLIDLLQQTEENAWLRVTINENILHAPSPHPAKAAAAVVKRRNSIGGNGGAGQNSRPPTAEDKTAALTAATAAAARAAAMTAMELNMKTLKTLGNGYVDDISSLQEELSEAMNKILMLEGAQKCYISDLDTLLASYSATMASLPPPSQMTSSSLAIINNTNGLSSSSSSSYAALPLEPVYPSREVTTDALATMLMTGATPGFGGGGGGMGLRTTSRSLANPHQAPPSAASTKRRASTNQLFDGVMGIVGGPRGARVVESTTCEMGVQTSLVRYMVKRW